MQTLILILQLIPLLIEVIKAVEKALPAAGYGSEKIEAVRKIMETSYAGIAEAWPTIEKIIGIIVELFNKTGVFKK